MNEFPELQELKCCTVRDDHQLVAMSHIHLDGVKAMLSTVAVDLLHMIVNHRLLLLRVRTMRRIK